MKVAQVVLLLAAVIACTASESTTASSNSITCKSESGMHTGKKPDWVTMVQPCIDAMKNQVNVELTASLTYLAMGAHFSRDKINRPGFAQMFFDSASEEREHAIKIIDYLLMRGELTSGINDLIHNPFPKGGITTWTDGLEALNAALALETSVTNDITNIIKICEDPYKKSKKNSLENVNDYHLVDYLTGEFLEEQFKSTRDIAGKISVLGKMKTIHGDLGEYLFDKKLLNGELPAIG